MRTDRLRQGDRHVTVVIAATFRSCLVIGRAFDPSGVLIWGGRRRRVGMGLGSVTRVGGGVCATATQNWSLIAFSHC